MCAMMQKLRMSAGSVAAGSRPSSARGDICAIVPCRRLCGARSGQDLPQRSLEIRKLELEAGVQKPGRKHPAALQKQLALAADCERSEFEHPFEQRHPEFHPEHAPQRGHQLTVLNRMG